ncbi:protein flightless-1-like, partial [Agrilus planipennis]|uniref:Protein flightless-1-like n=1 Tax=Agrilus planipennis TaxID=224129 RepID=A0A7F5R5M3_AGRPL
MANTGVLPFVRGLDFARNDFSDGKFPEAVSLMTGVQWLKLDRTNLNEVPKEMGQLLKLEHLSLTRNNLEKLHGELTELGCLRTLNLRRNKVRNSGIPIELFNSEELSTLDLSHNNLKEVPEGLEKAKSLLVLNLSNNQIDSIPNSLFINLTDLLFLDLSNNNLETLPPQTRRVANLQTLILNNNPLEQYQLRQLPSLVNLETLHLRNTQRSLNNFPTNLEGLVNLADVDLSQNMLPKVPDALYSLPSLKRLNLSENEITELSTAIELWQKLQTLNLSHNKLKSLPASLCKITTLRRLYVNDNEIDFEGIPSGIGKLGLLEIFSAAYNQLEMIPEGLCRCVMYFVDNSSGVLIISYIFKGMKDIVTEKNKNKQEDETRAESLKPKRWDEKLEKPPLNYSEIFEDDAGQIPGLCIWEIENFLPNRIDECTHGKFYEGDCYIVLKTLLDDSGSLTWKIYFWIGKKASLDKLACAAIHAVNLRNYLGAQCRTIREEQGDESEEFLSLFDTQITYIEGGRTLSGFYTVEDMIYEIRCYRIHAAGASIHLETVAIAPESLDPGYVFMLDAGPKIFLWYGKTSKNTLKSKARLMAEKINKNERKNKAEILTEMMGKESTDFLRVLGIHDDEYRLVPQEHVDPDFVPVQPRLYQVRLGMGYLELPQVEIPHGKLTQNLLNSKNVYILDCYVDVFVWIGKKSTRLVNAAAVKLSEELFNMIDRPDFAMVTRVREGTESQ